jgi:hypothetical protein
MSNMLNDLKSQAINNVIQSGYRGERRWLEVNLLPDHIEVLRTRPTDNRVASLGLYSYRQLLEQRGMI